MVRAPAGLHAEYVTGSDYPIPEGEDDPSFEDAVYNEDLYGEDDPFPDEDGESPAAPRTAELPRAAEVTRIAPVVDEPEDDDANATRAGPPIHLEVISGPDQGTVKRFRGVRMVIGRTRGCDFKLSDNSVSRRHLELVMGDGGVLLRDLGSGNGTRVNGEKVTERVLRDGDEVALGQTRFRFVDELAALRKRQEANETKDAPPSEMDEPRAASTDDLDDPAPDQAAGTPIRLGAASPDAATQPNVPAIVARRGLRGRRGARSPLTALAPGRKRILALAGVGGLGVLALILVIALAPGEPPPPPPNPNLEAAARKMQAARNALRDQRFEEAILLIEEAEALVAGSDATGLLEGARKELAAQRGLEEVRTLYRQGEFERARDALAEVPIATVVNEDARARVAMEIDDAEAQHLYAEVEAALQRLDVAAAEEILARLPREMAQELTPRLEEVRHQALAAEQEAAEQAKQHQRASRAKARSRRQADMEEAFAAVSRKFHQGEFQRAALECDRVIEQHRGDADIRQRAHSLKKLMPLFGRYLDEGETKYRAGNLTGAARPYRKARELYRQIGFDGALGALIDERLARASLAAGKDALERSDLATASRAFREALALDPSARQAKDGLSQVERRAEELYLEAYIIRDREPREAANQFRMVRDALPKGSPTREKAENQLKALGY